MDKRKTKTISKIIRLTKITNNLTSEKLNKVYFEKLAHELIGTLNENVALSYHNQYKCVFDDTHTKGHIFSTGNRLSESMSPKTERENCMLWKLFAQLHMRRCRLLF